MEIIILLVYFIFFLVGDFLGKRDKTPNIDIIKVRENIIFSLSILGFIFITLAIGLYHHDISNSVIALLIIGLGLGFEKGQGNLDDFSWLSKNK